MHGKRNYIGVTFEKRTKKWGAYQDEWNLYIYMRIYLEIYNLYIFMACIYIYLLSS